MRQTAARAGLSQAATGLDRCLAWGIGFRRTIRGRILVAFLLMSMITGALGVYAVLGISRAGTLVAKTFDESLMSINYARAAAADFASMRAAFARRWITSDPEMRAQLDESVDAWGRSMTEDLEIAAQRSQSERAVQAAANVQHAARMERRAAAPDRRRRTRCELGDARPLYRDRRTADRPPGQLHRRRRLPLSPDRALDGVAGDVPEPRLYGARTADLRGGGVAAGAAHHRAGGRRFRRGRTDRRWQARRRNSPGQRRRAWRSARRHAPDARQHQDDDGAGGGAAALRADASGRRAGELARRRRAGRRGELSGARQLPGGRLPRHRAGLAATGHAHRAARTVDGPAPSSPNCHRPARRG